MPARPAHWVLVRSAAATPLLAACIAAAACDGDGTHDDDGGFPRCVEVPADDCAPLYEPTFDKVFSNTLETTCASPLQAGSCHASADAKGASLGGLVFADIDESHDLLLGAGSVQYVEPGDPACSMLMVRLEIDDPEQRMPPGDTTLDARERCSISRWIAEGAER